MALEGVPHRPRAADVLCQHWCHLPQEQGTTSAGQFKPHALIRHSPTGGR